MKRMHKKLCAAALAFMLLANSIPSAALYRGVLGDVSYVSTKRLNGGLIYSEYRGVTDSLNERAYIFEYTPNSGCSPTLAFGDTVVGTKKLSALAADEAAKTGQTVLGGVNGDFFSFQTGVPMGAAVKDGRLISNDDKNGAVGFTADGEVIFGTPEIYFRVLHTYTMPADSDTSSDADTDSANSDADSETHDSDADTDSANSDAVSEAHDSDADTDSADSDADSETHDSDADTDSADSDADSEAHDSEPQSITEELPVSYFNKYPTIWGSYMLDDNFAASTCSSSPSLEIVITPDEPTEYLKIGSKLEGKVSAVHKSVTDTPIGKGEIVISVNDTSAYYSNYLNVNAGDKISIEVCSSEGWDAAETVIGGSDIFIKDGKIISECFDEAHEKTANPRTALGVRADGTVIVFALDGRQADSYGMRMISLAETLRSFGCVFAMNLDGGGSTTAVVNDRELKLANSPSGGSERSISNALLFLSDTAESGIPEYLFFEDENPIVTPGESISFDQAKIVDRYINECAALPEDAKITVSFDRSRLAFFGNSDIEKLGRISEDGTRFIAGSTIGEVPLLVEAEYEGKALYGKVNLFIVGVPDRVDVNLSGAVISPDNGFDIDFDAYYGEKQIVANPALVEYKLVDEYIKIAGEADADDSDDFAVCSIGSVRRDGRFVPYSGASGAAYLYILLDGFTVAKTLVIYNLESLPIGSTELAPGDTSNALYCDYPLDASMSLDLYADDPALSLYAEYTNGSGETVKLPYLLCENEPDSGEGPYHYRASTNGAFGSLSFAVRLEAAEVTEATNATDNSELSEKFRIGPVFISYNDTETIYYDTYGHWARASINALSRLGIVGGEEYNGRVRFAPERSLSRAEFAIMICRALELDTSDTAAVEALSAFSDTDVIPEWAGKYIGAVAANKLMNGKRISDDVLNFDAQGKITRQEIMQVVGNLLTMNESDGSDNSDSVEIDTEIDNTETSGIHEEIQTALPSEVFKDKDDIAAWALDNVNRTLSEGIITGYSDNTLKPKNNVTRAEAATVILRLIDKLDKNF